MKFEMLPVIDRMFALYQSPPSPARFQAYLQILQGNSKADLVVPVGGFNPMAKSHVLTKMSELMELDIESVISHTLPGLDLTAIPSSDKRIFQVALNLADDLKGGWTNRFTADYDSKFKLNALVTRNFCVPVFWTSETYDGDKIVQRTLEYCYRTICWLSNPKPKTLEQHVVQERTVAEKINTGADDDIDFEMLNRFYTLHKNDTEYATIFNFLYGDAAAASLGNTPIGIKPPFAGFRFARWLAEVDG